MSQDPRSDVIGVLDLVSIDTPDGVFRFLVGTDGRFVDVNGDVWWGSRLISGDDLRASIQGEAPSGSLTLSFIPDPDGDDLIAEIRALGTDYIRDREIIFWDQPILSMNELAAPSLPPERLMTRRGGHVEFTVTGAIERRIAMTFEGPFTGRNVAPGTQYTVADHSRMVGTANASLRFMPTDNWQEQKLFG